MTLDECSYLLDLREQLAREEAERDPEAARRLTADLDARLLASRVAVALRELRNEAPCA